MPVIYPLARLEFQPEPVLGFIQDHLSLVVLVDTTAVAFAPEAAVAFDFTPYAVQLVPIDGASLFNEDSGAFLFNEDTNESLFAEEPT